VNARQDAAAPFVTIARKCHNDHYHGGSYSFFVARILYCGDIGAQTGFGRVAEELIPRLSDKHEIHGLAVNWHGDPSPMQQYCRMYPAQVGGPDPFGSHRIAELAAAIQPDLVWITNDLWCIPPFLQALKPAREQVPMKVYGYSPIDSYGIFPEFMQHLDGLDGLGTYTQFGKAELEKAGYTKTIDVIPHGVDRSKFFPLDRDDARRAMGIAKDDFVCSMATAISRVSALTLPSRASFILPSIFLMQGFGSTWESRIKAGTSFRCLIGSHETMITTQLAV